MSPAFVWEHSINRSFSSWMLYFCRYWGSLPRRHIVNIGQNSCVAHEDRRNEYYSPAAEKLGHGLARELFIMWVAVGCLQSWSICSSSVLSWAVQLPLSSTAADYGLLDGNAALKRLCNTDARIWSIKSTWQWWYFSKRDKKSDGLFLCSGLHDFHLYADTVYVFIYYIPTEKPEDLRVIQRVSLWYSAADHFR